MAANYEVGSIVEGKVIRIKPFGAIVQLENGTQGLVHISQIANSFVQDINDHLKVDDVVKVKILSIDETTRKISLSIRDALPPAPKPEFNKQSQRPKSKPSFDRQKRQNNQEDAPAAPATPESIFEEKMKEFLKQSNERHASLNKRNNRR